MKEHMRHKAPVLLVIGLVLILIRLYTNWDIWVVIGALLIIKAIIMFAHPCKANYKEKKNKEVASI